MRFNRVVSTREHVKASIPLIAAGKATRKGACRRCGGHGFQAIPYDAPHGLKFNRWCDCALGKRLRTQAELDQYREQGASDRRNRLQPQYPITGASSKAQAYWEGYGK